MASYIMPIMPKPGVRFGLPIMPQPTPGGNRFQPMPVVAKPVTPSLVYKNPVLPGRAPVRFQLPIMSPITFKPTMRK